MLWVIALGGALGTLCRYAISRLLYLSLGSAFPLGTLTVNMLGSFLVGLVVTLLLERSPETLLWRAFIQIGFCGGFTTFSGFSWETLMLYQQSHISLVLLNIVLNIGLCLVTVVLGAELAKRF